jgi:hypothetical protein
MGLPGLPNVELLSESEKEAIAKAGELATLCFRIVDFGPNRTNDLNEIIIHVHAIQHAIMAQAAARAYPDVYRRLGASVT